MSAKIMIHEGRVVLNASALPDPREVSYDLLLSYAPILCFPRVNGLTHVTLQADSWIPQPLWYTFLASLP